MKKHNLPVHNLVSHWGTLLDMTLEMLPSGGKRQPSAGRDYIIEEKACRALYDEVTKGMESLLEGRADAGASPPALVVRDRLRKLPYHVTAMYFLLVPAVAFFIYLTSSPDHAGGVALWIVRLLILSFLAFPLLLYRRRKTEILEDIHYQRHGAGAPRIIIDRAPECHVLSGLAQAYARHLFHELYEDAGYPSWLKEGWVRQAQWTLLQECSCRRKNPALLNPVIDELAEELKCAVIIVSGAARVRPPAAIRRMHSRRSTTSFGSFLTGKPLLDIGSLFERSLGTACFFLAARKRERHDTLKNPSTVLKEFTA